MSKRIIIHPNVGGLNPTRRVLLETIKFQTGICAKKVADKYFNVVDRLVRTRGKRDTVLRLKAIHHITLNYMLRQPIPTGYPIKVDRGLPKCVKYLRSMRNTTAGIQAALSLTNYYRAMVAPGVPDFTSLTSKSSAQEHICDTIIQTEVPLSWKFVPNDLPSVTHLYKTKKGPNGLATHMALRDLDAIARDNNLLEGVKYFINTQNDGETIEGLPQEVIDFYKENPDMAPLDEPGNKLSGELDLLLPCIKSNPDNRHSRLAIKREGGGKDRVFAIADYWTQCALDPLHHHLAKILSTIQQDCTFDQSKGVEVIKLWTRTSDEIYSLDLSSATDRFPRELQMKLLCKLTDCDEYGQRWADLMANREFHYKGKTFKWAVGQPLGALSSWPMFALTHHYVVRYCEHQLGIPLGSSEYYLLGDDIVLNGHKLAKQYQETMALLGVTISATKSVTGKSAEFAKRLFTQGVEVSPAPVKMLDSLLRDGSLIKATVEHLLDRGSQMVTDPPISLFVKEVALIKGCSPRKLLDLALSPVPLRGRAISTTMLCSEYYSENITSWSEIRHLSIQDVQIAYWCVSYNETRRQIKNMQKLTDQEWSALEHMEIPGLIQDSGVKDITPLAQALDRRSGQLLKALGAVSKMEGSRKRAHLSPEEVLVPNLNILSIIPRKGSKARVKFEALIIAKTIKVCKYLDDLIENRALDTKDKAILESYASEACTL